MKSLFPKTLFGFYKQSLKRYWPYIIFSVIAMAAVDIFNSVINQFTVKWFLDEVGVSGFGVANNLLSVLLPIVLLVVSLHAFFLVLEIIESWISGKLRPIIKKHMSEKVYENISQQSVAFFKDNSSGFLVEQANYVLNNYAKITMEYPKIFITLIASVIINISMLSHVHWAVLTLFIVVAGFRLIWCSFHLKDMTDAEVYATKQGSILVGKFVDSVSNFLNIKLFSHKFDETKYLNIFRDKHAAARQKSNYYVRKFWAVPFLFEKFCIACLLFIITWLYGLGQIGLPDIAFTITAFFMMMNLVREFTWSLPDITENWASARQGYASISKSVNITDKKNATELKPKSTQIDFNNVSFKYKDEWVVHNLNLHIKSSEKVGIVGLSGAGKSTLLYLLMRLYDVNSGTIKIDGKNVSDVRQESLRNNISFVPQESVLFNRTFGENISYGKKSVKKEDIISAAKQARAHDFIMRTEHGYETYVGDRGITLSGGQRQRIAIAHAILKNAPILVLDEATSALDSETETAIQKSFANLMRDRTTLAVAHRLSTLRQMDRIIVMDKGKIVESGKHSQLIKKKNGIYAKMWKLQSEGFIK
ncbi:MAG TPA: ABC transporter ATP-binding protein [Alphaproteobacteria bacterium]|nr:ABC transporter ATP-binding protein [Alphaproteobacteria bacterium]